MGGFETMPFSNVPRVKPKAGKANVYVLYDDGLNRGVAKMSPSALPWDEAEKKFFAEFLADAMQKMASEPGFKT